MAAEEPQRHTASGTEGSLMAARKDLPYPNEAAALYNLALLYEKGRGGRVDVRKAFTLYKKAAELGDAWAQCNLGVMYLEGVGAKQDLEKGIEWMRRAARQGDAKAQYNLGLAYHEGEGVRRNSRYARAWLGKAAKQGHRKAARVLKRVGESATS